MSGTLFVVATPIGNLEDLTPRAARMLGAVDVVLCEDTRHTGGLLRHIVAEGIGRAVAACLSLHQHNEAERIDEVIERLEGGDDAALVSDAGTPCLSDPGARLVAAVHDAGLAVVSVPGPFAAAVAFAAAGASAATFSFWGFIAKRSSARRNALVERLFAGPGGGDHAHVFYVPGRDLRGFVQDIDAVAPRAFVVVARELTKIHEGYVRGGPAEVAAALTDEMLRGEAAVIVQVNAASQAVAVAAKDPAELIAAAIAAGTPRKEALRSIAKQTGKARRFLYKLWLDSGGKT